MQPVEQRVRQRRERAIERDDHEVRGEIGHREVHGRDPAQAQLARAIADVAHADIGIGILVEQRDI